MCTDTSPAKQSGLSLVESIMFIVVVSIGLVGILSVISLTTRASADPLVRKQALALAESLMEEITLQPFTYCAPGDAAAATARSSGDCAGSPPGAAKSRYSLSAPFDTVADYDGFSMHDANGGIRTITNEPVGLAGYGMAVAVLGRSLPGLGPAPAIAPEAALLVSITVTGPDQQSVVLESYRTRYAPNALP